MILKYDFAETETKLSGPSRKETLATHLAQLEKTLSAEHLDAMILTSKDPFISEYVPLANNPRYGATAFTGSVGDAIYWTEKFRKHHPKQKPISIIVDGRYHLQADRECPLELVEVVKLDVEPNIEGSVRELVTKEKKLKIGADFERTSVAALQSLKEAAKASHSELVHVAGEPVLKALSLAGWKTERPIFSLTPGDTGRTPAHLLHAVKKELAQKAGHDETLLLTAATDDAAFLLNARGYHLPNTASFLAYTFFAGDEIIVFLPASSKNSPLNLDPAQFSDLDGNEFTLTVIRDDLELLKSKLKHHKVKDVFFNAGTMNGLLPTLVQELFPHSKLHSDFSWVRNTRVRKTHAEQNSIRSAFLRSSTAIAKTLRWGKAQAKASEVDLSNYLYQAYADEGAVALSFKTISGAGPNSAIVHYSNPSKDCYFEKGSLALLDSGAYYSNGFCTDCTRGYFANAGDSKLKPEAWQTEIYTATLKAAIQVFLKPVDAKLTGKEVDSVIRGQVKEAGYDYLHGTGHGVGIHVHEEGIRLSTLSQFPQSPHACVSVEPGIYLQGKGGVRVENVVLLNPVGDETKPSAYEYENVAFVGYDWDLIDVSKLNSAEKTYLKSYEEKCRKLGNQLTDCPL
jgi:Xaa-Pro aminopeptidase